MERETTACLLFDGTGQPREFRLGIPEPIPTGGYQVMAPAWFIAGLARAWNQQRITCDVAARRVLKDGVELVIPADRPTLSHSAIEARINAASLPANVKDVLLRLVDLLLEHGLVEL